MNGQKMRLVHETSDVAEQSSAENGRGSAKQRRCLTVALLVVAALSAWSCSTEPSPHQIIKDAKEKQFVSTAPTLPEVSIIMSNLSELPCHTITDHLGRVDFVASRADMANRGLAVKAENLGA